VYKRPDAAGLLCAGIVARTDVVVGRGSSWHRIPWCGPLACGGQTVLICAFLAPSDGTVSVSVIEPQLHRRAAGRCDHHARLAGARHGAVNAAWCSAPTCGEHWLACIMLGHHVSLPLPWRRLAPPQSTERCSRQRRPSPRSHKRARSQIARRLARRPAITTTRFVTWTPHRSCIHRGTSDLGLPVDAPCQTARGTALERRRRV